MASPERLPLRVRRVNLKVSVQKNSLNITPKARSSLLPVTPCSLRASDRFCVSEHVKRAAQCSPPHAGSVRASSCSQWCTRAAPSWRAAASASPRHGARSPRSACSPNTKEPRSLRLSL
eukprot:scaffold117636_cov45-Phaeocystis_antarctica.AAC.2